jgi:hypothetical protein
MNFSQLCMKCKLYFTLVLLLIISQPLLAQQYWQQETNYTIKVRLDDEQHMLHAEEEIEYINHSPSTLTFIWFHLWPNAYSNRQTAFARQQLQNQDNKFYFASPDRRGFIDSLNFKVNGVQAQLEAHPEHIDIVKLILPSPLAPGSRITITTPFRVKLPDSFSRLGHAGQSYQITQWYPKPAVYDRDGWHPMPYLDQGEFYSEFGRFDVSITLPANYVVGATGDLQNADEREWLEEKARQTAALVEYPSSMETPPSDANSKTLRFVQDRVHDFAWFADKRYNVLKGEVSLPHSGRKVYTWVMFLNNGARYWKDAIPYVNQAIHYYSLWNGDYPYNHATAVDGALSAGGGMEYPNITVIGSVSSASSLETVIVHEVGHNWFYGILGTNERRHAWMDEGLNTLNEMRYTQTLYPDRKIVDAPPAIARLVGIENLPQRKQYELAYLLSARHGIDQPIDLPSDEYTVLNYAAIVYSKTGVVFNHVRHYLGDEQFDAIMRKYFEAWKFKHPQPEDLRRVFEQETGKSWSWLFDDLIPTANTINYSIQDVPSRDGSNMTVSVTNLGRVPAPFSVSGIKDDKIVRTAWFEGFRGDSSFIFQGNDYDFLLIDAYEVMPDLNRGNHLLDLRRRRDGGNFKPVQLKFFPSLEDPRRNQLFVLPALGANTTDKFMAGLTFYNSTVPGKPFNFVAMPMYSFGRNALTGLLNVNFNFFPGRGFRQVKLSGQLESFAGYAKAEPRLTFTLMPRHLKFSPVQTLTLRHTYLTARTSLLPVYRSEFDALSPSNNYNITSLEYDVLHRNALREWNINLAARNKGLDFTLLSLDAKYDIHYSRKNKIRLRAFGGSFVHNNQVDAPFRLGMSGSLDFLADHILLDRAMISNTVTAFQKQRIADHGGFRAQTNAFSTQWLAAANAEVDIPALPLSLYFDAGYIPDGQGRFLTGTGVNIPLLGRYLMFHLPVAGSNYENHLPANWVDFRRNIRFTLRLNELNPYKLFEDNILR